MEDVRKWKEKYINISIRKKKNNLNKQNQKEVNL